MPSSKKSEINPAKADNRSNYCLTDFFLNYDEVNPKIRQIERTFEKNEASDVSSYVYYSNFQTWIYCILASICTAFLCFFVEYTSGWIFNQRKKNIIEEYYFSSLIVWILSAVLLATISTGLCHIFGAEAQGAGVPELKCILSGARMSECLEFRILIAKFFGLIAALGGGFVVGRVGPGFHFGALCFTELSKISYFKDIRKDSVLKSQSIMIGGAVGYACCFGTPFAGLIAGVELSGKLSTIKTMWILYVSLFVGTITWTFLAHTGLIPLIVPLNYIWGYTLIEILMFAILGIICGIFSALFIKTLIKYQQFRNKPKTWNFFKTRFTYTWVMIIITALLQYHIEHLRFGDKTIFNSIFGKDVIDHEWFYSSNQIINILILLFFKTFLFFIGVTCPIPAGVFGPFVMMGALLGRAYGEFLFLYFGVTEIGKFSILGAAAVSAMSTRFLAMTLMVLELTGDINLAFPLLVTVLCAYGTGNFFTKSFFYSTIELRKLPYVPKLMKDRIYNMKAKDIIQKPKVYLHSNSTFHGILEYLTVAENICIADYIPVVLDENDNTLFGIIKTENLIKYFRNEVKNLGATKQYIWLEKLEVLLRIYGFLDEEAIVNATKICERAKKVIIRMKVKNEYRKQIFSFLEKKKTKDEQVELAEIQLTENNYTENENEMASPINTDNEAGSMEEKKSFFNRKIDFSDNVLGLDRSPITVNPSTNLCKIHYLIIALGISTIFIAEKGCLKGVIKRNYFLGLNANKIYPS